MDQSPDREPKLTTDEAAIVRLLTATVAELDADIARAEAIRLVLLARLSVLTEMTGRLQEAAVWARRARPAQFLAMPYVLDELRAEMLRTHFEAGVEVQTWFHARPGPNGTWGVWRLPETTPVVFPSSGADHGTRPEAEDLRNRLNHRIDREAQAWRQRQKERGQK